MNDDHIDATWIEIDLLQLKQNIHEIKKKIGKTRFCFPLKANAYGHGLLRIAKAAEESFVDYLAVFNLSEALKLRKEKIRLPILVLGAFQIEQIPHFVEHALEFTLSSVFKAKETAKYCQTFGKKALVHIEVDSGMQRTGMRCDSVKKLYHFVQTQSCFELKGIFSHFATADRPNDSFAFEQIRAFQDLIAYLNPPKSCIKHLANSGGVAYYPASLFDMVRPGLLTYGYFPGPPLPDFMIKPCFSLKSKISYFKVVEKGKGISYGHTYVTNTKSRIVTVPVGYGDGYRRALSNRASVLIRGKKYPIVGSICMDQMMINIGVDEAYVGDEVVLIGKQENEQILLDEICQLSLQIPYEALSSFNERIPRVYKDGKNI